MNLRPAPPQYSNSFFKSNSKGFLIVGRTVPSFRIAAEMERTKWKQFRSYLDKKDMKKFDQMYDYVKLHNNSCSNACCNTRRPYVNYIWTLQTTNQIDGTKKGER